MPGSRGNQLPKGRALPSWYPNWNSAGPSAKPCCRLSTPERRAECRGGNLGFGGRGEGQCSV